MRTLIIILAVLFLTAGSTRALESDIYSISTNLFPGSAHVSFSVGYPRGYGVTDQYHFDYADVFFFAHFNMVCLFYPTNDSFSKHLTAYEVFCSDKTTAKRGAKSFLKDTNYIELSFSGVKTIAGDHGWLIESKRKLTVGTVKNPFVSQIETKDFPAICHSYFFDSGKKGSLCIQITTLTDDPSWRSELDNLVLKTLQLNESPRH